MTDTQAIIVYVVLLLAVPLWVMWTVRRDNERTIKWFIRMFPGRCFICSLHAWEVMEGLASGKPPKHFCIERGEHCREEER